MIKWISVLAYFMCPPTPAPRSRAWPASSSSDDKNLLHFPFEFASVCCHCKCPHPAAAPSSSWTHLITSKKQHTHTERESHKERRAAAVTKYIPDIRLAALLSALSQMAARQQQQQQQWAEAAAAAEKFVSQTSCGLGQLGLPAAAAAAAAGRGLSRFTGFWYLVCQLCIFCLLFFTSAPFPLLPLACRQRQSWLSCDRPICHATCLLILKPSFNLWPRQLPFPISWTNTTQTQTCTDTHTPTHTDTHSHSLTQTYKRARISNSTDFCWRSPHRAYLAYAALLSSPRPQNALFGRPSICMYVCIFFFCVAPAIGLQLQCQGLAKSVRPKNESDAAFSILIPKNKKKNKVKKSNRKKKLVTK